MEKSVCQNKWCKATYERPDGDTNRVCPKCMSMDSELSGGVSWNDKVYEGGRFDGLPHQVRVKVTNYIR